MIAYIITFVVIVIILIYGIFKNNHDYDKISFEESFNKAGLPIITLYNDCYPLNFLVDTGSDDNFIDTNILQYVHYIETDDQHEVICASGSTVSKGIIVRINDGEDTVEEKFYTIDISSVNTYKDIKINGILGSRFCADAKFVIDFNDMTIYSK